MYPLLAEFEAHIKNTPQASIIYITDRETEAKKMFMNIASCLVETEKSRQTSDLT